jgi:polyphosphate glucokinase
MGTSLLGFDIGGSSIKFAVVDTHTGKIAGEVSTILLPQPATPEALLAIIRDALHNLAWSGPFGVGYPGVIRDDRTLSAAHMDKSFIGHRWLDDLRTLSSKSVALINDADAAGLAEVRFGAARDYSQPNSGTVLVATLGTGIGTAFFHGGRLFPNTEFGHIQMGDREAEQWAAGAVRVREQLEWPDYGQRVNLFLQEMERLLSPDLIVLGGGVSENFELFRPYLQVSCEVAPALLGNTAGLIGAALATALDGI